jgi:hypothetical protein
MPMLRTIGLAVVAQDFAGHRLRRPSENLIADVHSALTNLGKPASEAVKAEPPVPIKQTIKPGFVCRNRNNQAGGKLSAHAVPGLRSTSRHSSLPMAR